MKYLYTIWEKEEYVPADVGLLGIIPAAILPRFVKGMELCALSYEDNAARNDIRRSIMTFLTDIVSQLREPQERLYRLLDTHLSGAEYALVDDVPVPAIPPVPAPSKTLLQQLLDLRGEMPSGWFEGQRYGDLSQIVRSLRQVSPEQRDSLLDKLDLLGDATDVSTLWGALRGTAADAADISIEGAALVAQLVSTAATLQALGLIFASIRQIQESIGGNLKGTPETTLADLVPSGAVDMSSLALSLENISQLLGAAPSQDASAVSLAPGLCEPPARALCKIGSALSMPEPLPPAKNLCSWIEPGAYATCNLLLREEIRFTETGGGLEYYKLGSFASTDGNWEQIRDLFFLDYKLSPNDVAMPVFRLRGTSPLSVCVLVEPGAEKEFSGQVQRCVLPFGSERWLLENGATIHQAGLGRQTTTVVLQADTWYAVVLSPIGSRTNASVSFHLNLEDV